MTQRCGVRSGIDTGTLDLCGSYTMSNETIELLKNYDPVKMQWPAMHQEKIDGVPVRVIKDGGGQVHAFTRQGERVTSIGHIIASAGVFLERCSSVVMELHIAGKPFKEISGLVRRDEYCPALIGHAFDFVPEGGAGEPWITRRDILRSRLENAPYACPIRMLAGCIVDTPAMAEAAHADLMKRWPDAEGSVLHSLQKPWQPGKRCWGTQRMKPVPTVDLMIVGFKEAISQHGEPLGMVGRLNAQFSIHNSSGEWIPDNTIGIGPGALTHAERKELWYEFKAGRWNKSIAEIRYMKDDSYDALRQPTFKQWRPDLHVADIAA